ncbi:MAG: helix-hairpin-helix domain-containing protein [Planctomycetes bacterium]|nr:helix-hairpin-helix domain-containing protein [Planctomycetota bacterium]
MFTRREAFTLLALGVAAAAAMGVAAFERSRDEQGLPNLRAPLDLNRATWQELELLPDFGPTLAHAVIEHRIRHGSFARVEDLRAVPGMTDRLYRFALPEVTVDGEGR